MMTGGAFGTLFGGQVYGAGRPLWLALGVLRRHRPGAAARASSAAAWSSPSISRRCGSAARRPSRPARAHSAEDREFLRFVPLQLFNRQNRFSTLVGLLFCLGTLLAIWTSSIWLPTIQTQIAGAARASQGTAAISYVSHGMMLWGIGGIFGYAAFGFIADAIGRRPAIMLYNLGTMVLGLYLFLGVTTFAPVPVSAARLRVLRVRRILRPRGLPARAVPDPCAGHRGVVLQRHRPVITSFGPLIAGLLVGVSAASIRTAAIMTCFALLSILAMVLGRETRDDELPR